MNIYDRNAKATRSAVDENFIPFNDEDPDTFLTASIMKIEDSYERDTEGQEEGTLIAYSECVVNLDPTALSPSNNDKDEARYHDQFLLSPPEMIDFTQENWCDDSDSELEHYFAN